MIYLMPANSVLLGFSRMMTLSWTKVFSPPQEIINRINLIQKKKISACRKKLAHPNHQSNSNSLVHDIHVPLSATAGITHTTPATPRRYLAYLAAFSRKHTMKQVYEFLSTRLRINREDLRIWKFKDEVCVLEYLYIFFRTNEGTAMSVLWNSWSLNF